MQKRPPWLKVSLPGVGAYYQVQKALSQLNVHTVCKEARCPNAAECWGSGTATFMIMGDICTRGCRFCAVTTGHPKEPLSPDEPERIAQASLALGLRYVVLTSVDRDDLPDGGAAHFVQTVQAILRNVEPVTVEVLTPDFSCNPTALEQIAHSGAQVLGHNLETTREMTPVVRDPRCDYKQSLRVLETFRALAPKLIVKSSLLMGIGETDEQLCSTLADLRAVGVDWVTLGQYLRPTKKHLPVERYVEPQVFADLADQARAMGFPLVTAGPLVRSSYRAAEHRVSELLAERC